MEVDLVFETLSETTTWQNLLLNYLSVFVFSERFFFNLRQVSSL